MKEQNFSLKMVLPGVVEVRNEHTEAVCNRTSVWETHSKIC